MRYHEINPVSQSAALVALTQNDPELDRLVIAVALHEPDVDWAERYCLSLAAKSDNIVRGNAILGFGHLARRFGRVPAQAIPIVAAALTDQDPHVRGQAETAVHDIEQFTPTRFRDRGDAA